MVYFILALPEHIHIILNYRGYKYKAEEKNKKQINKIIIIMAYWAMAPFVWVYQISAKEKLIWA